MKKIEKEPVEVSLHEDRILLRGILFIILILISFASIGYAASQMGKKKKGYRVIEASSEDAPNCGNDFTFNYFLGMDELSPTDDYRQVTKLYSDAMAYSYKLFDSSIEYEGLNNLYSINKHPNERLKIDFLLYNALNEIIHKEQRLLYYGPVNSLYRQIFYSPSMEDALNGDPSENEEIKDYLNNLLGYIKDSNKIELQFLEDNEVCLFLSSDFKAFLEDNEVETILDFSYFKNAFIIDYLADFFVEKGFDKGQITSIDGYFVNLSDTLNFTNPIIDIDETGKAAILGTFTNESKKVRGVQMRSFIFYEKDINRLISLSNGITRTLYLNLDIGQSENACKTLTSYSELSSVIEVLSTINDLYISDTLDEEKIILLEEKGIQSIWKKEKKIYYTDASLIYQSEKNLYVGEVKNNEA